jgi:hypothetical protein
MRLAEQIGDEQVCSEAFVRGFRPEHRFERGSASAS